MVPVDGLEPSHLKAGDFDIHLSAFAVAGLYHHLREVLGAVSLGHYLQVISCYIAASVTGIFQQPGRVVTLHLILSNKVHNDCYSAHAPRSSFRIV